MDLTNVSTEDLHAFQAGDLSKVSDAGLQILAAASAAPPDPQGAHIDAYLAQTDTQLGFPAGTSARQINQESHFNPAAVNPNSGAAGLAQVMPATVQSLSNSVGRPLDPMNVDDALYMHRTLMQQNMARFGNPADALRAYNSGWQPSKWNNDETNNYVSTILPTAAPQAPATAAPGDAAGYTPFGTVVPKLPVDQLTGNKDWLNAGRQLFSWDERKAWVGTDADLSDWLQTKMIWGANNIGFLSMDAAGLINHGTPDDARAYLYARDQWDAVQGNSGTKWHAVGAGTLDPLNVGGAIATVVGGILSLGTGAAPIAAGDIAASQAAKAAVKLSIQKFITYKVTQAVGRAGIMGAAYGGIAGTTNSIANQSVNVTAHAQDSISTKKVLADGAIGAGTGLLLGTAGDLLISAATPIVRNGIGKIASILDVGDTGAKIGAERVAADGTTEIKTISSDGDSFWAPKAPATGPRAPAAPLEVSPGSTPASPTSGGSTPRMPTTGDPALDVVKQTMDANGIPMDAKATLPPELAGATPKWKTSGIEFESDVDKALYITSQATPSKADGAYRAWLTDQGLTEAEIDSRGAAVRAALKEQGMRTPEGDTINFADQAAPPKVKDPVPVNPNLPPVDPSVTEPIPTHLTAEEVQDSVTRKQKGRLMLDDMPTQLPTNELPFKSLVIPEVEQGLTHTRMADGDILAKGHAVADQLRPMSDSDLTSALTVARNSATLAQHPVMSMAGQILHVEMNQREIILEKQLLAAQDAGDKAGTDAISTKLESLRDRMISVAHYDDATGSAAASLNRQRQIVMNGMMGKSTQEIMAEHGLTQEEAIHARENAASATEVSTASKVIEGTYAVKIQDALVAGDLNKVNDLLAMKRRELNAVAENMHPASSAGGHDGGGGILNSIHHFFQGTREGFLSNLFSLKTVAINAISIGKSLALPVLRYIVTNPLALARQAQLVGAYGGMRASIGGALEGAFHAFKLESSVITRNSGVLMDGEMALKGKLGGAIRFFPRVLNASDEFLAHINYGGEVQSKAAFNSTIEGQKLGLTGQDLKDHVSAGIKTAMDGAFEPPGEDYLQPIVNKGVNLGLSGEELQQYVEKYASTVGGALQHGSDKEALDYTRDVLYKRAFSGGGLTGTGSEAVSGIFKKEFSSTAAAVESWMRKAPELSLMTGQLFFRTPVRVFEEAIRLTPGYQFLAPGFMRDLMGYNGAARQIRTKSEALVATALGGCAMSLYAQGRISASGVYMNPQQSMNRQDGPGVPVNTIHDKDGTAWNFNAIEQLATPMKIWINAFEGWDELKIKEAQEQYVNQDARRHILAMIAQGTMAMGQTVKDSNLFGSIARATSLGMELNDPEADESAIIKAVGKEIGMAMPSTVKKVQQANDPRMLNPATWGQAIQTGMGIRQNVSDSRTSFAYDPLGEVRTLADIGTIFSPISSTSTVDRERGYSPDHSAVMTWFDNQAQEAGTTFKPIQVRNKQETGMLDLRTMLTEDGKMTMYDKVNENYRSLNPAAAIRAIADSPLSAGTYKYPGAKPEAAQAMMKEYQQAAFEMTLDQEPKLKARYVLEQTNQARAQAGLMDFGNRDK